MKNWIKEGCAVAFMAVSLSAGAQTLADVKPLSGTVTLDALKAGRVSNIRASRALQASPVQVGQAGRQAVSGARTVVKRETTETVKPKTYYKANRGYYNIVPGMPYKYDGSGMPTDYTNNGILGYIDRDLEFINQTPEFDTFEWNSYGETYTVDQMIVHPFFNTDGYMVTPKLTTWLAGADSTYQMGGGVTTADADGMVLLNGGGFIYNVDVDAIPFSDTWYLTLSGSNDPWSGMLFGGDIDGKPVYVETFDAPSGGPVVLDATVFYVFTSNKVDLSSKTFEVSYMLRNPETGEWNEEAKITCEKATLDQAASGLRLWQVMALADNLVMARDSFQVMIAGPQDGSQWALPIYYRGLVPLNDAEAFAASGNTASFFPTVGEYAGQMGPYAVQAQLSDGSTVEDCILCASLDIYQHVGTPFIVIADDDATMMLNETGTEDFATGGETKDYLLLDWAGSAADGVALTATVSESTDGDWLTVTQPVAATGLGRTDYFALSITAPSKSFLTAGRRATLTLSDNNGYSRQLVIYQGDHAAADEALGIAEVNASGKVSAVYADGAFELTYPTDYKTLKVYSLSGQLAGSYKLSANGTDRISAAGLQDGIYLLQFVGKDAQTVKVQK